ncbi:MAG TPA: ECF-type sigma factor [Terriglobales bacterium]|nr:ECF-type sigma factor [Terriglobales bacterium]
MASEANLAALMQAAEAGGKEAADALFSALYAELRRLAKRELARHGAPLSLGATTLLHTAYIEIAAREGTSFAHERRFMGYAARVMRGLIIDYARSRHALKRGGQFEITSLEVDPAKAADETELARVGDALDELAKAEPALAEIVDLKFFCGFTFAEIGAMHGVSERTVQREWDKARIYLHSALQPGAEIPG